MNLDQIFDHGKEAAAFLFSKQGAVHPMWICESVNGQVFPICIEMPDRKDRDKFAKELKETFQRNKVVRYVSLLEAWMVATPEKEKESLVSFASSASLKDHPDRREVIMIAAEDVDGKTRSGVFYILRPEHGDPTLSPFDEHDNHKPAEGRFTRLLNTEN